MLSKDYEDVYRARGGPLRSTLAFILVAVVVVSLVYELYHVNYIIIRSLSASLSLSLPHALFCLYILVQRQKPKISEEDSK